VLCKRFTRIFFCYNSNTGLVGHQCSFIRLTTADDRRRKAEDRHRPYLENLRICEDINNPADITFDVYLIHLIGIARKYTCAPLLLVACAGSIYVKDDIVGVHQGQYV
jgi:hypothetical protein